MFFLYIIKDLIRIIKVKIERYPFLISLIVNSILFALTYLFFTPRFLTNDDVSMLLQISGVFSSDYNEFILFSNVLIAKFLNLFYTIDHTIPWYTLFLIFTLFISHIAFLFLILKKKPNISALLFYTIYYLFSGLFITLNLQFTIIGTLTSLAGLSLLFLHSKTKLLSSLLGIGIFVLGSLIRWKSGLLALSVFSFVYLIMYFRYKETKKFHVKKITLLIISTLLIVSLQEFNKYKYRNTEGYETLFYFNKLKSKLIDYHYLDFISKTEKDSRLKKVNWSNNDYLMLKKFFFYDNEKYSIQNFEKLINEDKVQIQKLSKNDLQLWIKSEFNKHSLFIIITAFILFALQNPSFINFFKLSSYFIFIFSLLLFIIIFFKPPPYRVYAPLLAFGSILPLILFDKKNKFLTSTSKAIWRKFSFFIITITILFLSFKILLHHQNNSNYNKKMSVNFHSEIKNLKKDFIYIKWGPYLNTRFINPFENCLLFKDLKMVSIGTLQQTPYNNIINENYGITNLYLDIVLKNEILVFTSEKLAKLYIIYMKENYQLDVDYTKLNYSNYQLYNFNLTKMNPKL